MYVRLFVWPAGLVPGTGGLRQVERAWGSVAPGPGFSTQRDLEDEHAYGLASV